MPEYLAPGVFIEETSYRARSIEGVSTTTTGFVGAARTGPVAGTPEIITSLTEYEATFGGREPLVHEGLRHPNHLWQAVRAFFEEGGKRLYVARAFTPSNYDPTAAGDPDYAIDCARATDPVPPLNVNLRARHPGENGRARVTLAFTPSQNRFTLEFEGGQWMARVRGARHTDVVRLSGVVAGGTPASGLYRLLHDPVQNRWSFAGFRDDGTPLSFDLADLQTLDAGAPRYTAARVRVVTATVEVEPATPGALPLVVAGLALDPDHAEGGTPDSLFAVFAANPADPARARTLPIVFEGLSEDDARALRDAANGALASATTADSDAETARVAAEAARDTARAARDAARTARDTALASRDTARAARDAAAAAAEADPADAALVAALGTAESDLATAETALSAAETALETAEAALEATEADLGEAARARTAAGALLALRTAERDAAEATLASAVGSGGPPDGLAFLRGYIAPAAAPNRFTLADLDAEAEEAAGRRRARFLLTGGSDGRRPVADAFEGRILATDLPTGLRQFEGVEDISIVAAPGSTASAMPEADAQAIANALITHCRRMRYRIAVLDSREGAPISEVRAWRARFDSSHAALYYPWVRILDPVTGQPGHQPPSGFVAGIYARNDITRAVWKAPANEVVNLALGFERFLNTAQQEVLNPEGINCFRFFEGRGMRLWGARTISSDPEWKYVNLRRYFAFLERSIERGTQWAVFEPNGERLWANVRRTIEDFLLNEWQNGALLGDRPEKAYFVKCDRSTMSQNDLDNGRLVCQVGVAPLRPAEFVIFRIGQWTADRKA